MATEPNFIERDANVILQQNIALYESLSGKKLQPAQPEMLLINALTSREVELRAQIQSIAVNMLLGFSKGPVLDYITELLGVTRLSPTPALCTIQLNFEATHPATTIPEGIRIQSLDGKVIFETLADVEVIEDQASATVSAQCLTAGAIGNGYSIAEIKTVLDPQPFLSGAENTTMTAAGSDQETDEQLIARARLAPSTFSVAGPTGAYKYWAKSASASIIDVEVTNPVPGEVHVFPLVAGVDETPPEILAAVVAMLDDEKKRPLSDTVIVTSPTAMDYALDVELTLFPDAVEADVIAEVEEILTEFTQTSAKKLGRNVTAAKLTALCMLEGKVYSVAFPAFTDVEVDLTEYGFCTALSVTSVGTNE